MSFGVDVSMSSDAAGSLLKTSERQSSVFKMGWLRRRGRSIYRVPGNQYLDQNQAPKVRNISVRCATLGLRSDIPKILR